MQEKQVDYLVKERKKLIKNYNEEMKLLEYKIIKFMNSLIEKYASAMELLKNKSKHESISILSYTKEEIDPILDLYKKIYRRINSLGKEMIKINDKIVSKYFIDKFKEILENTKDETFSKNEIYDKSFSEDSEAELDFNNLSENLQNNNSLEKNNNIYNFNEIEVENNFNNTEENNNINIVLPCTIHPDRRAEWACREHCTHKFCGECYNMIDNNNTLHGRLLKINGVINDSKEAKIFLERFKKIFSLIYTRCNVLMNLNKLPEFKELDEFNYEDLDLQIQFIMKVHAEYKNLDILSEETNELNEQLYKIVKKIFLW